MNKLKRLLKQEKGFALPMALLLIFVAGVIVTPVVWLIETNLRADQVIEQKITGTYAADSGIQYAIYQFTQGVEAETYSPGDPIAFPEGEINGFEVSVSVMPVDILDYKIVSVARDVQTEKTTEIVAYVHSGAQYEAGPSPFNHALATLGGDLTMTGSCGISCIPPPPPYTGDVWITGNINKAWSNFIDGTAYLTGTVNGPNQGAIYEIEEGSDPCPRPEWLDTQTEIYVDNTFVSQPILSGDCGTWNDVATTYNDPVCVNGNMTLGQSGTYRFRDSVWVKGNLTIQGGTNHIYFEDTVRVDGNVIMGGNGDVTFVNTYSETETTIEYNQYSGTVLGDAIGVAGYTVVAELTTGTFGNSESGDIKLQESDGPSGPWTDVSGGSFPTITKHNDNNTYTLNYYGDKPYIRAIATVVGTAPFGVDINKTQSALQNNVLYIGGYLYCGGSRSAKFEGKVSVGGASTTGGNTISFDGSKFWGVSFDVEFMRTIRANGNVRFGSGRDYIFRDVIYATGNVVLDGNAGTMNIQEAIVADGSITIAGSSTVGAVSYETSPFLISRQVGGTGVSLTGNVPVTAIVYAPDSAAYVSGSSLFEGAMVAKSAQLDGNVRLKYPVVLDDREDLQDPNGGEASEFSLISYSIQN
jgi:hypothetical protein